MKRYNIKDVVCSLIATLYIWFGPDGSVQTEWRDDNNSSTVVFGPPPPLPTPAPWPQPNIPAIGTPRPGQPTPYPIPIRRDNSAYLRSPQTQYASILPKRWKAKKKEEKMLSPVVMPCVIEPILLPNGTHPKGIKTHSMHQIPI